MCELALLYTVGLMVQTTNAHCFKYVLELPSKSFEPSGKSILLNKNVAAAKLKLFLGAIYTTSRGKMKVP